ncbi:MAG: Hpt domain-containing protein [Pedosphaera sp.]|nr:Hpt domain-containing protein [Pedosphaera sp.]
MCYLQDSPGRFEEMKRLVGVGDRKSLGLLAHSIKGSSSIFGLSALESLGHQLENESETEGLERLGGLIQELDREFKLAAPEILRLSSELAARA